MYVFLCEGRVFAIWCHCAVREQRTGQEGAHDEAIVAFRVMETCRRADYMHDGFVPAVPCGVQCVAFIPYWFTADAFTDSAVGPTPTPTAVPMTITFMSPAFHSGASIPPQYTCAGVNAGPNISPPLAWSGAPQQTISFAVIMEDISGGVYHWIVFNIPAGIHDLPENIPHGGQLANGARQGINDVDVVGYYGPCPALPRGSTDTYVLTIYALDTTLNLDGGASWRDMLAAINGHILAEGQFDGTFKLPKS
jgi:Raf kinase inhibitor-like YbhB/YbcL family protein